MQSASRPYSVQRASLQLSPDGARAFYSDGKDLMCESIALAAGGVASKATRFASHGGTIRDFAIAHDGRRIVPCGDDRVLRLWDAADGSALACWYAKDYVRSCHLARGVLAFSADGRAQLVRIEGASVGANRR